MVIFGSCPRCDAGLLYKDGKPKCLNCGYEPSRGY